MQLKRAFIKLRVQRMTNKLAICRTLAIMIFLAMFFYAAQFQRNNKDFSSLLYAPNGYNIDKTVQDFNNNNTDSLEAELQEILNLELDVEMYNILDIEQVSGALIHYITTKTTTCNEAVRKGDVRDGGWNICMDVNINPQSCMVYSIGIGNNWSFDDAMAEYGCDVYSFDPTIGLEDHQRSERVWFYNVALWHENMDDRQYTKHGPGDKIELQLWKCRTLEQIRKILHHENSIIDVLKIDIEGSEWRVFPEIAETDVMKYVKQIVFEIHISPTLGEKRLWETYVGTKKMMENNGFKLWFVRPNQALGLKDLNYGKYAGIHKCCMDLSFVNINYVN